MQCLTCYSILWRRNSTLLQKSQLTLFCDTLITSKILAFCFSLRKWTLDIWGTWMCQMSNARFLRGEVLSITHTITVSVLGLHVSFFNYFQRNTRIILNALPCWTRYTHTEHVLWQREFEFLLSYFKNSQNNLPIFLWGINWSCNFSTVHW